MGDHKRAVGTEAAAAESLTRPITRDFLKKSSVRDQAGVAAPCTGEKLLDMKMLYDAKYFSDALVSQGQGQQQDQNDAVERAVN